MSLRVNVQGDTGAGTRKPYGHAPTCQCTRCTIDRMTCDVADSMEQAGSVPDWAKPQPAARFDASQVTKVIADHDREIRDHNTYP